MDTSLLSSRVISGFPFYQGARGRARAHVCVCVCESSCVFLRPEVSNTESHLC